MARTTISTKYQVVIPRDVRKALGLSPGQSLQILTKGDVIYLVPIRPAKKLRGFVKGINTKGLREKQDRV